MAVSQLSTFTTDSLHHLIMMAGVKAVGVRLHEWLSCADPEIEEGRGGYSTMWL